MAITRYQNRRGTAAEWTAANPVLADGEFGFERDTKQFKLGDGVTAWNALAYAGGGTGASGDVDSSFYDDTHYFTDPDDLGLSLIRPGGVPLTLAWDPIDILTITGDDLALNADNTVVDVLNVGNYAITLRTFVEVDTTDGPVASFVTHTVSGGVKDLALTDIHRDIPLNVPVTSPGFWGFRLVTDWNVREGPCSLQFHVGATRLDSSTGTIRLSAGSVSDVLIRRMS